ncbi:hypothetical protein N431DRAFT_476384 [Stipitochalara longipes BDJ]|nr:hypothetical protein N431DRAFT_476384 [Stipitochalara longipes BDJ]
MTRHNLSSHISWLLSHEVTPPVGVHAALPTHSSIEEESFDEEVLEEGADEEIARHPPSPIRTRQVLEAAVVVQEFARPALPSSIIPRSQMPDSQTGLAEGTMGTITSASKPARPKLMSQHQLATPASTTTSTAPSSLKQGYATFLRNNNGTPSSRPSNDIPVPRFARALQTPQTPRQTPRPTIEVKTETVDLTGDDNSENLTSRSSSVEVFGESQVLWKEDSASRAEPLPRTSKKRKSDGASPERPKRANPGSSRSPDYAENRGTGLDEFIDIDDVMPRSQKSPSSVQKSLSRPARPSIEITNTINNFEEEYQVTETISRVETRTRKSFSIVPSLSGSIDWEPAYPHLTRAPASITTGSEVDSVEFGAAVQVTASPASKIPAESSLTPKRRQDRRMQGTILDSEDDEAFSDVEKRASCSPRTSVTKTPRVVDVSESPKRQGFPTLEATELKCRDLKESKSRTGSPLRPISRNLSAKPESVPSPFQRDSPTRLSTVKQQSSQQTPASSLGPGDRKLVVLYLDQPTSISLYRQRVVNSLSENALTAANYEDEQEVVPLHLKEERKSLLEKKKAYVSLDGLASRWRSVTTEKKTLAKTIYECVNKYEDVSVLEERSSSLTKDIQAIEKEVGQLLHASGAVKDGFGTGSDALAAIASRTEASKVHENAAPLPSGSSVTGSAQVILQTQIPVLPPKSASTSNQRLREEYPAKHSSGEGIATPLSFHASPSPIRHKAQHDLFISGQNSMVSRNDWASPKGKMKQPDFYRSQSPMDYDLDDDDIFNDLPLGKPDLHNDAKVPEEIPDYIEDEYGDDEDYEEMLEVAEEIEKRHSLPESFTSRPSRAMVSQTLDTAPESSKRNRSTARKNMYSHVDPEHAGMLRHPWSEDVKKALKDRFKLTGFRYHQLDAINATLAGNDAFVLMPTGGGKSLCYQLPAVIQSGRTRGVTIVISPLLSLMNDQVEHLRKINIRAATLNSATTMEERSEIQNSLKENYPEQYIQLLYITPEMMTKSTYISNTLSRLHRNKKLARIVIDEAHCVSQWGHDFRPDYVAVGQVRKQFPNVPIMALTATATENVKVDVMHQLGMKDCPVYSQSFNRPNLHYEVRKKRGGKGTSKESLADYVEIIKVKYKNQSGIIYTLSKKGTERLAASLQSGHNIKVHHYHADMPSEEKARVQKDWQSGKIQVVVATIAFGMGIDKADVRFVIHDTIPKSLEGYYQETGRAGRDGKRSGCYLYYGYSDTAALKRFIYENDASPEQKERQRRMLSSMIQFCENRSDCRRVQVLAYFGERFFKEDCEYTCDNCSSDAVFSDVDFTAHARTALKIVKRLQCDNVTVLHCVDVLRGAATKKIKDSHHHEVEGFGAAKDVARGEVERLFFFLLVENALEEHNIMKGGFASQYLHLGPKCREFITGKRKVSLQVQASASPLTKSKQTKSARPQSTMVSSPAAQRRRPAKKLGFGNDENEYDHNDFVVSDEDDDAFEPVVNKKTRRGKTPEAGPPITLDGMAGLPDIHRVTIIQFVEEAKKLEENLRNKNNLRKPFFTEANFREMARCWTVDLEQMMQISDINVERVKTFGSHFLPLVAKYQRNYENTKKDIFADEVIDKHENVIDLISDEEGEKREKASYTLDNDEEAAMVEAEGSKYFAKPQNGSNSKSGNASGRSFPWTAESDTKTSSSRGRGSSYRGKGRGAKKTWPRKSNGSASGQSSSGVSKRKFSGGAKKSRASKAGASNSSRGSVMRSFGNSGGSGMGGGGIGMMPT